MKLRANSAYCFSFCTDALCILNTCTRCKGSVTFKYRPLLPFGTGSVTHRIGGWFRPRASFDVSDETDVFCTVVNWRTVSVSLFWQFAMSDSGLIGSVPCDKTHWFSTVYFNIVLNLTKSQGGVFLINGPRGTPGTPRTTESNWNTPEKFKFSRNGAFTVG
jgi:hypothetical protein